MKKEHIHNSSLHKHDCHHESLKEEIISHIPFAILSVALSIIALSLLTYRTLEVDAAKKLFHVFHYLHLLFSGTGVVLIFRKYSNNVPMALLSGFLVPAIFCTLSDSIMPFIGGLYLGLDMHFHWCFIHHLGSVLPFLTFGVLNGFVIGRHAEGKSLFYSAGSHFFHIFISAMASILYFYGFGFDQWYNQIGFIFVYLIIAVLVPCSLADIVVPISFAKFKMKRR
ncbi:hypothetical protein KAW80_00930 [Candidatus Babeliales bacterium]|nr:hypothetical protein [Candidatus Babeliales bacterium]